MISFIFVPIAKLHHMDRKSYKIGNFYLLISYFFSLGFRWTKIIKLLELWDKF